MLRGGMQKHERRNTTGSAYLYNVAVKCSGPVPDLDRCLTFNTELPVAPTLWRWGLLPLTRQVGGGGAVHAL